MSIINKELINSYKNKELILFLYENFCKSVPERIKELKRVTNEDKSVEIQNTLHALKNLFANIGAEPPAKHLQELEDRSHTAQKLDLDICLPEIENNYNKSRTELKYIIDNYQE